MDICHKKSVRLTKGAECEPTGVMLLPSAITKLVLQWSPIVGNLQSCVDTVERDAPESIKILTRVPFIWPGKSSGADDW